MLTVVICLYVINVILLFIYGMHTYLMVFWYNRHYKSCEIKHRYKNIYKNRHYRPVVTIQLPVFNEKYVVKRLIDSVIKMDYPKRLKQIQVLDDSTDETLEITKKIVAKYKKKGFDISLIHRTLRTGHKGGALREALPKAKGELIAIFDADFIPARNFLKITVPVFDEDPKIGMVQTRWGYLNAEYSLLTKAQALGIDGHFLIDQVARAGKNLFMNFNGTAGIWRKTCIIDAGNWQDDTLTEDFDLSYRAELKGWRFRYIKDVVNPSELPVIISAYKSQQFRWAKGSIQTAIKLLGRILRSKESFLTKFEAMIHLTYYSVHPLMLLNILLTLPVLGCNLLFFNKAILIPSFTLIAISTMGPIIFYAFSQYALNKKEWMKRILWVPLMVIIGTGIAVNNTRAIIEAIIGKKSEFVRTPKLGIKKRNDKWTNKKYAIHYEDLIVTVMEIGFAVYSFIIILQSLSLKRYYVVPFFLLYCMAFMYILFKEFQEFLIIQKNKLQKV